MGNVYRQLGDLEDAISSYQQALELIKSDPNKTNYANTIMNIGHLFITLKDYHQAKENLQLGLSFISPETAPLNYIEGKRPNGDAVFSHQRIC